MSQRVIHVPDIAPCTVRLPRAGMTDDEFWADVARGLGEQPLYQDDDPHGDYYDPDPTLGLPDPCTVCGSLGACGYDAQGQPMIHTTDRED